MPFPKHNRLVVRGTFAGTPEIWSYSMHFTTEVTAGADVLPQDWNVANVTAALTTLHTSSKFASSTRLTGWRGYQIGPDGRTIGDNLRVVELGTPVVGVGTPRYPSHVSLVVTTEGASRGPARLGRFFLPSPAISIDTTDLRLAASDLTTLLASLKTCVESLKNAMYPVEVIGESMVNVSQLDGGVMQNVVKYKCGRVLDTMRSRRNKLVEDYQELAA